MKTLMFATVAGIAVLSVLASQATFYGGQPQPAPAGAADSRILVRYAEACVELAEVELQRAQEMGNAVPEIRLEWLRANLEVAREQLEIARELDHGAAMPLHLSYARNTAEQAAKRYEAARQAAESPLLIKELQLRAEVARLRHAMWKESDFPPSLIDQMQWQIDRLTEEIVGLNHRLEKLEK